MIYTEVHAATAGPEARLVNVKVPEGYEGVMKASKRTKEQMADTEARHDQHQEEVIGHNAPADETAEEKRAQVDREGAEAHRRSHAWALSPPGTKFEDIP